MSKSRSSRTALPILLRKSDVPAVYGFTERQLKRWIHERKIAVVKPSGRSGPAFSAADLQTAETTWAVAIGVLQGVPSSPVS